MFLYELSSYIGGKIRSGFHTFKYPEFFRIGPSFAIRHDDRKWESKERHEEKKSKKKEEEHISR